jgi:uncharacterized membrane protein
MGEKAIRRSIAGGTGLLLLGLVLVLSASLLVTPKGFERASPETDNVAGVLQQQQPPYVEGGGGEQTPRPEQTPVVAGEQITREQAAPTPPPAIVGERVRLPITGLGLGRAVAIVGLVLIISGVLLLIRGSKRAVGA